MPIIIQKTMDELKRIFHTQRTDSIIRSLTSAGILYEREGRGNSAAYAFTEPQSVLKLILISDYGFTPSRYLEAVCELFKGYFYGSRPYSRMFQKDIAEILDVHPDTISNWIKKFHKCGILAKGVYDDLIPVCYCSSFSIEGKREVVEITEEEYRRTKARISAALQKGISWTDAMHSCGNVFELKAECINGFYWNPLFNKIENEIITELEEIQNNYGKFYAEQ